MIFHLLAQAASGPDWTAVYGVAVSTIALLVAAASVLWQVYEWRQKGRGRGEVGWRLGVVGPAPEHGLPEPVPVLIVSVVNRDDAAAAMAKPEQEPPILHCPRRIDDWAICRGRCADTVPSMRRNRRAR